MSNSSDKDKADRGNDTAPDAPKKSRQGGKGRPFPPGNNANPKGRPKKTLAAADEHFLDVFFSTIDVLKGGVPVRATRFKLFMEKLVEAGIKGRAIDRKLVLQYFEAIEARKALAEQNAKAATEGGTGAFDWGAAKEQTMRQIEATIKAARRAERG